MKALRTLVVILVIGLLAVFVGAPFMARKAIVQGTIAPEAQGDSSDVAPSDGPLGDRVLLQKPIIFPVKTKDKPAGHVRAQKGLAVELIADLGSEVVVQLVESQVRIPRVAVGPIGPGDATENKNFAAGVQRVGNRIVEYWFPKEN